jgi:hypothetical protein
VCKGSCNTNWVFPPLFICVITVNSNIGFTCYFMTCLDPTSYSNKAIIPKKIPLVTKFWDNVTSLSNSGAYLNHEYLTMALNLQIKLEVNGTSILRAMSDRVGTCSSEFWRNISTRYYTNRRLEKITQRKPFNLFSSLNIELKGGWDGRGVWNRWEHSILSRIFELKTPYCKIHKFMCPLDDTCTYTFSNGNILLPMDATCLVHLVPLYLIIM